MKVFISWSGKQSQAVANALREWLPAAIPGSQPRTSDEDLHAGGQWFPLLMEQLESTDFCIICLTPDNVRSPWLYFEAGAIAARSRDLKVCGFLTGISPSQIPGPFAHFQCVQSDSDGAWALVEAINSSSNKTSNDDGHLKKLFVTSWPRLRENLRESLLLYDPRATVAEVETEQPLPKYRLSDEANHILIEASSDKNGTILMARTMQGLILQTNDRQMCEREDPRSEAKWQGAIRELVQNGLIEGRGHNGEVFNITAEGYRVTDELKAL